MNRIEPGEPVIIYDYDVVLRFDEQIVNRHLTLRKTEAEGVLIDPNSPEMHDEATRRACKKADVNVNDVRSTVRWTRSHLTTAK